MPRLRMNKNFGFITLVLLLIELNRTKPFIDKKREKTKSPVFSLSRLQRLLLYRMFLKHLKPLICSVFMFS